jgi:hypothetical protein
MSMDVKLLKEEHHKMFYSKAAKLFYLSKRAWPDILTVVVSFLCTRVQRATVEDWGKLTRMLGYLKAMANRPLVLTCTDAVMRVHAYVDASYALHDDSKPHTGAAIYVGGYLVYASSRKQKCVTKSPTEAELVGLTDSIGLVELFEEFVAFVAAREPMVPVTYQDSLSVVSLVMKGGGVPRTKHLRARMNLTKEAICKNWIVVKHVLSPEMKADGFSKGYDPKDHKSNRQPVGATYYYV